MITWKWRDRAACKKWMLRLTRPIGKISLRHTKVDIEEDAVQTLTSLKRYDWMREEIDVFLHHREKYLRQRKLAELEAQLRRRPQYMLSKAQKATNLRLRRRIGTLRKQVTRLGHILPCGDYTKLRTYLAMLERNGVKDAGRVLRDLKFSDMRTSKDKIHRHPEWRWLGNKPFSPAAAAARRTRRYSRKHFSLEWKTGKYRNVHAFFVWTCLQSALTPCDGKKRVCDSAPFCKRLARFVGMFNSSYQREGKRANRLKYLVSYVNPRNGSISKNVE